MQKAEIEELKKNNMRYRLLKTEEQYYILDSERPFLIVYFLPLLIYFVPHCCYPISHEEYEELSHSPEINAQSREYFKQIGKQSAGIGLFAVVLSQLFDINRYLYFKSGMFSQILATTILLLVFALRLWGTYAYKLPKRYSRKGFQKLFIFPRFFKELIFNVLGYFFCLIMVVAIVYAVLTNQADNYIIHICLFIFSLLLLGMGNLFFLRYSADYWIKVTNKGKLYYHKNKST